METATRTVKAIVSALSHPQGQGISVLVEEVGPQCGGRPVQHLEQYGAGCLVGQAADLRANLLLDAGELLLVDGSAVRSNGGMRMRGSE